MVVANGSNACASIFRMKLFAVHCRGWFSEACQACLGGQTWDYCLAAELITMSCGVLFFLAFFLAMYVEVKARNTVYQLICKFFHLNNDW